MRDWTSIAKASGLEIPQADLERAAQTLGALEATFRPLVGELEVTLEPAAVFHAEEDSVT